MKVKPVITRELYPVNTAEMLIYYIPVIMGTTLYAFMNLQFINLALTDVSRRNIQMRLLSDSLEINF